MMNSVDICLNEVHACIPLTIFADTTVVCKVCMYVHVVKSCNVYYILNSLVGF